MRNPFRENILSESFYYAVDLEIVFTVIGEKPTITTNTLSP